VDVVIIAVIVLLTLGGIALGTRHIFLRVHRPRGFECSLRATNGDVPGLTGRFRAGYAGRELDTFVWRRLIWPSEPVRFPARGVRLDEERAPGLRHHLVSVPASFAVVPVDLEDGGRIDLAFSRRKIKLITAAIGG
jgi:hypothetical protein